jgi:creatinine amidohydrolase
VRNLGVFFLVIVLSTPLPAQEPRLLMEEMTWREIERALQSGVDTAVVTVGATEQHGPQIALASDSVTGDFLGPEVARRLGRALVAPNIRLGVSPHHLMFPGTIAVRTEVLGDLLREVIASLAWHGFRHVVLLPTHGGNFTTVERLTRELRPLYPHVNIIGYSDATAYIDTLKSTSERLGIPLPEAGSHAGLSETAMVLAIRPDLVRLAEAEPGFLGDAYGVGERMNLEGTGAIHPLGVLGDPRRATAELGREYLRDLAGELSEFARRARDGWGAPAPQIPPYSGLPEPEGALAEGIKLRRAGKLDAARAFFERRLEAGPGEPPASIELARTLALGGDFSRARTALAPLLNHPDPSVVERAHDGLAELDLYTGQFRSAIEHKQKSRGLRRRAGDREGEAGKLFYIGYIQSEIGDFEAAAASYRAALEIAPAPSGVSLEVEHLIGTLEVARGRLTQAQPRLRRLEDAVLQPRFAAHARRLYHLAGEILLAQGRVEDAVLNLAPAIAIFDHPLYRESLARVFAQAGRLAEAESEYRRLIELTDARLDVPLHYVKAHYALGRLYEKMGRTAEAREMYRKFVGFWDRADRPLPAVAEARQGLTR